MRGEKIGPPGPVQPFPQLLGGNVRSVEVEFRVTTVIRAVADHHDEEPIHRTGLLRDLAENLEHVRPRGPLRDHGGVELDLLSQVGDVLLWESVPVEERRVDR